MEICGGQTHTIVKSGHRPAAAPTPSRWCTGPGCPVCVTPLELIDKALAIARRPEVIFCSFGDMLRVPGLRRRPARASRRRAATCASSTRRSTRVKLAADSTRTARWSSSPSASRPPPRPTPWRSCAGRAAGPEQLLDPVLARAGAAGHGGDPRRARQPGAGLPGRRPRLHRDGLLGVRADRREVPRARSWSPASSRSTSCRASTMAVAALEEGRAGVENQYAGRSPARATRRRRRLIRQVFEVCDRKWRGIGEIPQSGFRLREEYAAFDAETPLRRGGASRPRSPPECIAGADPAGAEEAARVPGLRHPLHARAPAGRAHGLGRGRLRRLLPVREGRMTRADADFMGATVPDPARPVSHRADWPTAAAGGSRRRC